MEDDQQFCLRWNNHQSTLIQNFDTLLEHGTLVDCTLAAEGKYLKAHKVVLSACSPYFEGLLSEHYDKHPVFILKDVKFKELKAMMDYMYRGEVNISQDQLTALLKAAESLQIKGLSDSRTGGNGSSSSKPDTRQAKTSSQPTAASVDIPHASSGLTIEKNSKVPRQSLAQASVGDLPEDSVSPQLTRGLSSREGSQSPTSRKRKRLRRRSLGDDNNSVENHEASNSSDVNVPALGIAAVAEDKSHHESSDSLGRSALMQQLTKPADEMTQLPIEKPEPSEEMIQPKSEYLDDQEESVEDLTLDDDMNDMSEMNEQDSSRAGPSTHDPSQHAGLASWHIAGDRSNASGVVAAAGAPGATDEVFLAAHEAVQAQRDSQAPDIQKQETNPMKRTEIGETQICETNISEPVFIKLIETEQKSPAIMDSHCSLNISAPSNINFIGHLDNQTSAFTAMTNVTIPTVDLPNNAKITETTILQPNINIPISETITLYSASETDSTEVVRQNVTPPNMSDVALLSFDDWKEFLGQNMIAYQSFVDSVETDNECSTGLSSDTEVSNAELQSDNSEQNVVEMNLQRSSSCTPKNNIQISNQINLSSESTSGKSPSYSAPLTSQPQLTDQVIDELNKQPSMTDNLDPSQVQDKVNQNSIKNVVHPNGKKVAKVNFKLGLPFKCRLCCVRYVRKCDLTNHMKLCGTAPTKFKCPYCAFGHDRVGVIVKHVQIWHVGKEVSFLQNSPPRTT